MDIEPQAVEAYMDASAAVIGLPLAVEHRPGVLRYLQLVMGMAGTVMNVPLTPADESGNVFQPVPAAPPAAGEDTA